MATRAKTHIARQLASRFVIRDSAKEDHRPSFPGTIVSVNGSTTFTQLGVSYTWVNLYDADIGVVPAINYRVNPLAGTPVTVSTTRKNPPRLMIESINEDALPDGGDTDLGLYSLPPHAQTHRIPSDTSPGDDPLYIYQAAIKPLKIEANSVNLVVSVGGYNYFYNGLPQTFLPTTVDLTNYVPSTGYVRNVIIYFDATAAWVDVVAGTSVVYGPAIPVPYPTLPATTYIPCAVVKLVGDQTAITPADITDIRPLFDAIEDEITFPEPDKAGDILFATTGVSFEVAHPVVDDITGNILTDDLTGTIVVEG